MTLDLSDALGATRYRYLDIVEALERRVRESRLPAGTRLPAQRALAAELGVSIATVNKAYVEAARRGLVVTHVGRGTFVAGGGAPPVDGNGAARPVDLTTNRLSFESRTGASLRAAVQAITDRVDVDSLLRYDPSPGDRRHREAACRWLARSGVAAGPDEVVICNGLQHGLSLVLSAFARAGDVVLTEDLNYPGIKLLDSLHDVRVRGLRLDGEGLCPDALQSACEEGGARFVVCTPFVQNPTNVVMSSQRRKRIASIARRHDLLVIECDNNELPPVRALAPIAEDAPERTFYVSSAWRVTGFGVCIGFVRAPPDLVNRLAMTLQANSWMLSPLQWEVFAAWIEDGTTDRILEWHREENEHRIELARRILGASEFSAHPSSSNVWLPLPSPWRREDFVRRVAQEGVLVTAADAFVVGRSSAPHAVRVSLGGVRDPERLTRALDVIARGLASQPHPTQILL